MRLDIKFKNIYTYLLHDTKEFKDFFDYMDLKVQSIDDTYIKNVLTGKICENADIKVFMQNYPVELAYAIALIYFGDINSITPTWAGIRYPNIQNIVKQLTGVPLKDFINKYFAETKEQLERSISSSRYEKLFGELSKRQNEIIRDDTSKFIVVAAGPGSGKTKVLVHKLASLLLLEDIKGENLLMLTFSRAAAGEFKQRLVDLIGNAAYYVQIRTFHSFCLDILGREGKLDTSDNIITLATQMIKNNEIEPSLITKSVIVIDEAQDMDEDSYELIKAIIDYNEGDIRIITVGDDDQNIYGFRGSSSKYFDSFNYEENSSKYELVENYRSNSKIVNYLNEFLKILNNRMKTNSLLSKNNSIGAVKVIKYKAYYMEEQVAQLASKTAYGTVGILTNSNEEAMCIHSYLIEKGIKARLIQSLDGFKIIDILEIRYFLKQIEKFETVVPYNDYENAKQKGFVK